MEENIKMHEDMGMYGPPVDLSFKNLKKMSDALVLRPKHRQQPEELNADGKCMSCSMLLNNNQLPNTFGLLDIFSHFLVQPMKLMWLDLSFNILKTIDPVLCEMLELRSLYLHGNTIAKIAEVDKLRELQHLRSITLHGNEMENHKGYRAYVISTLTHLKTMDFSAVTPDERALCHRKILVKESKKSFQ